VADETLPVENPRAMEAELEQSRRSAAILLENLATKTGARRAVRNAANGLERAAHYVQEHGLGSAAAGIDRAIRIRPAVSIAVAVVAGYLVGRALRSR
jgi:hypothetical protein